MFDFFRKLFAPERSSETARERLRLVLLSDHISLAPDTVVALKRDLLEVISRYVDIDAGNADVTFEQREHEVAMLASIPITGVRERSASVPAPAASPATGPTAAQPAETSAASALPEAVPVLGAQATAPNEIVVPSDAADDSAVAIDAGKRTSETREVPSQTPVPGDASRETSAPNGTSDAALTAQTESVEAGVATLPLRSGNAARPRRRRRKKHGVAAIEVRQGNLESGGGGVPEGGAG